VSNAAEGDDGRSWSITAKSGIFACGGDVEWPEDLSAAIERERHQGRPLAKEPGDGLGAATERTAEAQLKLWARLIRLRRALRRRALNGRASAQRDVRTFDKAISAMVPIRWAGP
jgi:hypothetical protein